VIITRGTTPEITCVLPYELQIESISEIWISISQTGAILVDRKLSNGGIIISDHNLLIRLTQEETLSFKTSDVAKCGVRLLLHDGTAMASKIIEVVTINGIVKGGVIV